MIRTILKPLSFIPALLLIYMIFSFSSQTGDVSSQLSYKASYKIIETADYLFDAGLDHWQIDEWANKINFITRKLAHMAEYFALAVAVAFPLYVYGLHGFLLMLVAGFICVGVACADEYYQSFVAGRGPAVKDVVIDSIGVFFGIILVRIIGWTGRKTIFRPKKPKQKRFSKRQPSPPPYNPQNNYPPYGNPNHHVPPSNQQYGYMPPEDDFFIKEPDTDEWNVDVSDVMNNNTNYGHNRKNMPENDDLAYDWALNDHKTPDAPPPNAPRPRKRKEKDWFFDM